MKRLDNGKGDSPLISVRFPKKTIELLDALIAKLPQPVGPPSRVMVIRAAIDAGIEALAIREGIELGTAPKPINEKIARKAARKVRTSKSDAKTVHPRSRARAEKRAAARLAVGCTCKSRHVPACKLYRQPSATA